MSEKEEGFKFTYTAPSEEERREIECIRSRYLSEEESSEKYILLKKLNFRVNLCVRGVTGLFAAAGCLLFGGGLSLSLLSEADSAPVIIGALLGVCGIATLILSRFIYKKIKNFMQKKYGGRILSLTDELLSGEQKDG